MALVVSRVETATAVAGGSESHRTPDNAAVSGDDSGDSTYQSPDCPLVCHTSRDAWMEAVTLCVRSGSPMTSREDQLRFSRLGRAHTRYGAASTARKWLATATGPGQLILLTEGRALGPRRHHVLPDLRKLTLRQVLGPDDDVGDDRG